SHALRTMHCCSCHSRYFTPPHRADISTLSLHDALPISPRESGETPHPPDHTQTPGHSPRPPDEPAAAAGAPQPPSQSGGRGLCRSEEHTSELQSRENLVCRLLLEKKKGQVDTQQRHTTR